MNKRGETAIEESGEPQSGFFNQNSLFLIFGFSSAIFLTTLIELFKIIGRDYLFDWSKIGMAFTNAQGQDFYLLGMIFFCLIGFSLTVLYAVLIDKHTKYSDKLKEWANP